MLVGEYRLDPTATVGFGAHGLVVEAIHIHTYERVVAKRIDISTPAGLQNFQNESKLLAMLIGHPHIIQLKQVITHQNYGYLILERMETDLMTLIEEGTLTAVQRASIFYQVAKAVEECHSMGIAHLDIKPDNILLSHDFEVRLCDFGLSKTLGENGIIEGAKGTVPYIAPEACISAGQPLDGRKADVWSLAILYHVVFTDMWPFVSKNDKDLVKVVKRGEVVLHQDLTPNQVELFRAMTVKDPTFRYSISQVVAHITVRERRVKRTFNPMKRMASFIRQKSQALIH